MDQQISGVPIWLIVFAALFFGIAIWWISMRNRYAHLRNLIIESRSDIDVQLKRRHDLIPNLVETVRGYAAHEESVLQRVMEARSQAVATGKFSLPQEAALVAALNGLFARVEAYPDLKASQHFLMLQQELSNTEDRIAAARRFYNANVREYNTLCCSFPASLIAGPQDEPAPYLELDTVSALQAPVLDMSSPGSNVRALPNQ